MKKIIWIFIAINVFAFLGCKKGSFHKTFDTGNNKVWVLDSYTFNGSDTLEPVVTDLTFSIIDGQGVFESCEVSEHYGVNNSAFFDLKPGDINLPENSIKIQGIFGEAGKLKVTTIDAYQDGAIIFYSNDVEAEEKVFKCELWRLEESRTQSGKIELQFISGPSKMIFTLENK